ncbi:ParB/RepB/Spo0J family partition protein (plasmid) [Brevundimonas staleyi]|uniref:ParB/RepB/Spo0J family partition protein n=1 Tax=Brevundimonas staleyi TaxID=74326 RepID=A0ABW0FPR5_9CAUL
MSSGSSFLNAFEGLGAAIGDQAEAVLDLDIDIVDPDPDQPRQHYDEDDEAAMAASVERKGVLQPIKVRPGRNGRYIIVFGERRWRAAKRAGLKRIRALLHQGPDDELGRLEEQVIENDQRAGLNTAEMAAVVDRMLKLGASQAEIARRLSRKPDQIAMLAAIKGMPAEIQDLAPRLGARTLYELNSGYKANPVDVRTWLKDRDPATITQSAARALSARIAEDDRDAVLDGVRAPRPGAPRKPATPVPAPAARSDGLIVEVEVDGRAGVLLLQPGTGDEAWVKFPGRGRAERVSLSLIRLTGLRNG